MAKRLKFSKKTLMIGAVILVVIVGLMYGMKEGFMTLRIVTPPKIRAPEPRIEKKEEKKVPERICKMSREIFNEKSMPVPTFIPTYFNFTNWPRKVNNTHLTLPSIDMRGVFTVIYYPITPDPCDTTYAQRYLSATVGAYYKTMADRIFYAVALTNKNNKVPNGARRATVEDLEYILTNYIDPSMAKVGIGRPPSPQPPVIIEQAVRI